jgi:hypothetical protein
MDDSASPLEIQDVLQFKRALEMGFGRAILHLKTHDSTPYHGAMLEACLKYTGLNVQDDGHHAEYLFEAIQISGTPDVFLEPILEALLKASGDRESEDQLIALTLCFARVGNVKAKRGLYELFSSEPEENGRYGTPCANAIILLDGLDGLSFVLETLGRIAINNPDVPEAYLLEDARRSIGVKVVNDALEQWRAHRPEVAAYLRGLEAMFALWASQPNPSKPESLTYDQLRATIERVREHPITGIARLWGKQASTVDLERAAQDLLLEHDPIQLQSYLCIFAVRPFPLDHHALIHLVQHENDRVSWRALTALGLVVHPDVRTFALKYQGRPDQSPRDIALLEHNYQAGDHKFIEDALKLESDRHDWHSMAYDALKVFESNPTSDALYALMLIYERNPCLKCRLRCVKLLDTINALPDWVLQEAVEDASVDLRAWARDKLENRAQKIP